jgi:hypothetical protein
MINIKIESWEDVPCEWKYSSKDNPKDKAKELAIEFCSPTDVFKPNSASVRNAIKCCEQIIKLYLLKDKNSINIQENIKVQYWRYVITELNILSCIYKRY